jgi:molybdopterin/thiamine biosynthesis adenylyltransferase
VAEALSRVGLQRLTYIDFDSLEVRNLDRTHGATIADVLAGMTKGQVAARATALSHTAPRVDLRVVPKSLLTHEGLAAALDCDVIVCCVDRPWPRHVLNTLAYSHLISVVDGGIIARVKPDGTPLHVDWADPNGRTRTPLHGLRGGAPAERRQHREGGQA